MQKVIQSKITRVTLSGPLVLRIDNNFRDDIVGFLFPFFLFIMDLR